MALTKRQMQSYRKDSSGNGLSEKAQEYINKYRKSDEQIEEEKNNTKKQATKEEREAYVKELTKQVEEQKKKEQSERVVKDLLSKTVPFNATRDATTQTTENIQPKNRYKEYRHAGYTTNTPVSTQSLPESKAETKLGEKVGYVSESGVEGVRTGFEGIKNTAQTIGNTVSDVANGKVSTHPVAQTYSDVAKNGVKESSSSATALKNKVTDSLYENAVKYSNADEQEKRMEELRQKYSDSDIGKVTEFLTNQAYSAGYTIPADVASLVIGPAGVMAVMATETFGDALAEAAESGYDRDMALNYAIHETLNQAAVESLFDIAGGGFAEDKLMGMADNIPNAVGRTAAKIGITAGGEGLEEVAQDILTVWNKKMSGDTEADVDLSELGYSFLAGAFGGAVRGAPVQIAQEAKNAGTVRDNLEIPSIKGIEAAPIKDSGYTVNEDWKVPSGISKSSYYTVQDLWKNLDNIKTEEEAVRFVDALDSVLEEVENTNSISEGTEQTANKAKQLQSDSAYVRHNVVGIKEELAEKFGIDAGGVSTNTNPNESVDNSNETENTTPVEEKPVAEEVETNTEADSATEAVDTNNTVNDTSDTVSDTDNTTNNTETYEAESTVEEDSTADEYESDAPSVISDTEDSIAKALESVKVDPSGARNTLLNAFGGDAKAAVEALYVEGNRISREGGEYATEQLEQVEVLRNAVLSNATKLAESGAERLTKVLSQYGIKNVVVDSKLVTESGTAYVNGHYDPVTKEIHISPLLSDNAARVSVVVHELVHHSSSVDSSIVSDIIAAKDSLVESGVFSEDRFNPDDYIEVYADVIQNYGKSEAGKQALRKYTDSGMDAHEAALRVTDDYINEEIAGDFMAELANAPDVAKKLTSENRNFIQKILDAVVDFINKLRGKEDVRKYQYLADMIRGVLGDVTGTEVESKKVNTKKTKADAEVRQSKTTEKADSVNTEKRFSLSKPVEKTENLVAVHNLSEENLERQLSMGGFAMPSIAVVNAKDGHSKFGDVSVVFGRDSIDPEISGDNKIYSVDAWTPTYPKVEYEANPKVSDKLKNKYRDLYNKYGAEKLKALYPYAHYFEEQLNKDGGVNGILDAQKDNTEMMNVYLLDTTGKPIENVYKETTTAMPSENIEQAQFIIDKLGEDVIRSITPEDGESPISVRKRWMNEHGDDFKSAYSEYLESVGLSAEEAESAIDNMTAFGLVGEVKKARDYLVNGGKTSTQTLDVSATNEAIEKAVDKSEYEKWLRDLFDGGEKNTGVANGKDLYTASGNRRSFSATHYPVTLDNIVLAMKKQGSGDAKNASQVFVGSKTISAESATEYSSIDEVKSDSGRLKTRTTDEVTAMWDDFDSRLADIINRVMNAKGDTANSLIEQDRIGNILAEASRKDTVPGIRNVLTKYKLTTAVAEDLKSLVDDIKSAPVEYFEAKPERVVGIDEVKAFIVPDNISDSLSETLDETGKPVLTYKSGDTQARLDALNSLEDVRFSRDVNTAKEQKQRQKEREQAEYLKRQLTTYNSDGTFAKAVKPEAKRKFATDIAKNIPGVSTDYVNEQVSKVWRVIESKEYKTPEERYDALYQTAHEVSAEIISSANSKNVNPLYDQYKDLRDRLRTTPIKPGDAKTNIPDYSDWRKSTMGVLRLSDAEGAWAVDAIWGELCELYPEFFDSNETDTTAMIEQLASVANELRAIPGNPLTEGAYKDVDYATCDAIFADMEEHLAQAILSGYDTLAVETKMAQTQRKYVQLENASAKANAESMRDAINAQENFENERIRLENAAKQAHAEAEGAILRYTDEAQTALDRAKNAVTKAENTNKQIWAMFEREQKNMSDSIKRANKAADRAQERLLKAKENAKWRSEELRRTQERTALRKNITSELGKLYNSLVNPTQSKHIPSEMRTVVADLLEEFSGTRLTNGKVIDKTILNSIKTGESEASVNTLKSLDSIVGIIGRNAITDDGGVTKAFVEDLRNNVDLLHNLYEEIVSSGSDDISTKPKIMETKNKMYLEQVQRVVSMVNKYVENVNNMFLAGKVVNAEETAKSIVDSVSKFEAKKTNKKHPEKTKESFINKAAYDFMTPDTYLARFGEVGDIIMNGYRNAQKRQVEIMDNAVNFLHGIIGENYKTGETGWSGKLIDVSTKQDGSLMTPKDQVMEAYCIWQRPVGKRHMRKGGAYFLTKDGSEIKERLVKFDNETANRVFSNLTEQDKAICDAVVKYFSTVLAKYGNEASMYMYGYNKFSDKNYFPVRVAKEALPQDYIKMDDFSRLENAGFTKAVGNSNSSPIAFQGFFKTVDNHVQQMAYYAAYAPINNDVMRVRDIAGVRSAVEQHLGKAGADYLENFLDRIDKKAKNDFERVYSKKLNDMLQNNYKRAAVSWNISTVAKQPLSIVRAANSIDTKYITKAYAELVNHKNAKGAHERMLNNSAIARIKVMGFSDVGFGQSIRERYDSNYSHAIENHSNAFTRGVAQAYDTVINDWGMWGAGKADEVTWTRIWRACELEVADKYSDLSFEQQEKKVEQRFNEIIGETQVVDSVLDYTPVMENEVAKIYTPFMAEPVKQLNSLISAFDQMKMATTEAEKKAAKKNLGKTIGTAIVSNVILEPLVSVAFSMLRDEEDESDPEEMFRKALNLWIGVPNKDGDAYMKSEDGKNAVEALIESGYSRKEAEAKARRDYVFSDIGMDIVNSQLTSNIVGAVPFSKTIIESVIDTINGYDSSNIDVAGITKATKSVMNLVESYTDSGKQKTQLNLWLSATEDVLAVAGVPMRTVRRDLTALVRDGMQATDSYVAQWELNKWLYNLENTSARSQKNFYDIMANAAKAGDTEAYKYMSDDLEDIITTSSVGVKRSTILSALEQRGYEQKIGSDLWYIDLQAGFDLDSFNPSMKVEKMITSVYKTTKDDSILPSSISNSFTVNKETVKVADPVKYQAFAEEAGEFAYMILTNMDSDSGYKGLDNKQKAYAIKQAYTYARSRARKNYNSNYEIKNNTFSDLFDERATPSEVAKEIIWLAEDKDFSEDDD